MVRFIGPSRQGRDHRGHGRDKSRRYAAECRAPRKTLPIFRTIPVPERISELGRIIRHVAEQLPVIGIYYSPLPDAFANRLVNVSPRGASLTGTNPAWNAHEWDVR